MDRCGQYLRKIFFGWLSDRLPDGKHSAVLGHLVMAAGMLIMMKVTTATMLYVYSIVFGFGYGCLAPLIPVLLPDRFGRHIPGTAYGMLAFFVGTIARLGPVLGGMIYDRRGSYAMA